MKRLLIPVFLLSVLFSMTDCTGNKKETTDKSCCKTEEQAVFINARVLIKPDSIEAFKELCKEIISETRKEPGCVSYRLLQDTEDPCLFYFYEGFKNKEAQLYHGQQPYLVTFRERRNPMLQEPATAIVTTIAKEK